MDREHGEQPHWGQGLGYPDWFERVGPAVHDGFNVMNRYVGIPALRLGLGMYMSNPVTGYLCLLRTRGRKSGQIREIPLGYFARGDSVYVMAGFGRQTHWFQNVLACPQVDVILPGRSFSGIAEEVTDPAELAAVMPAFARSLGLAVMSLGLGNPWRQTDEELTTRMSMFPLLRIRATGIAPGPNDPGGMGWVVPTATMTLATVWVLRKAFGRGRKTRARGGDCPCARC